MIKTEWFKWVALVVVLAIILLVIYLTYGAGGIFIGAACFLAGKFLRWSYIMAVMEFIDKAIASFAKKKQENP